MTLAVLLLLGVFGLALLVWGWRGRRLDDHPVCRKCRFDLTGVYPERDWCPECGNILHAPNAIHIGNRKRRPVVVAFSVIVTTLVVLALFSPSQVQFVYDTALHWVKIEYALWTHDSETLEELHLRWRATREVVPTEGQWIRLAREGLMVQSNPDTDGHLLWEMAISHAGSSGLLSAQEINTYLQNMKDKWDVIFVPRFDQELNTIQVQIHLRYVGHYPILNPPIQLFIREFSVTIDDEIVFERRLSSPHGFWTDDDLPRLVLGSFDARQVMPGSHFAVCTKFEIKDAFSRVAANQTVAYETSRMATYAQLNSKDYWESQFPEMARPLVIAWEPDAPAFPPQESEPHP